VLHHQLDVRDGLDGCGRAALLGLEQAPRRGRAWSPLHRALEVALRFKNESTYWPWAACEAAYRLGQPFVTRYPLVKPLGNFGTVDGVPPGGPMVVDAQVSDIARALFEDLIPRPSRDGLANYPHDTPLAARLTVLLLNGSAPGAPGPFLLPPHNLREVAEACLHLVRFPRSPADDLDDLILGPDFPTGGEIPVEDRGAIRDLYERGSCRLRLRATFETVATGTSGRSALVISSLPYLVPKGPLVQRIGALASEGELPGVEAVRDDSAPPDRPVRIVLDLAADAIPDAITARLLALTPLESCYACSLWPWRSLRHLIGDFLATRGPDPVATAREIILLRDRFADPRRTRNEKPAAART
jgi:DNA gyrase/topoisomerase IV subunit A